MAGKCQAGTRKERLLRRSYRLVVGESWGNAPRRALVGHAKNNEPSGAFAKNKKKHHPRACSKEPSFPST